MVLVFQRLVETLRHPWATIATCMAVNLCRYAWSAALCPASVFRRWSVSLAAFRRHHRGRATLPDRLA
jgi:hypothetical protein